MAEKTVADHTLSSTEKPTLKTIARLAGLAVPTVSRALSDAPDIGQKTKDKVHEIARQIGYRRDRAALRLRTGKTNVIALVIGASRDAMNHTSHLISSIALELRGTPYHVIVMPHFEDESPMTPIRYLVETGSADGIVINRIMPNDPRVEYLDRVGFPFVMHGRTEDCHKYPHFDFDNIAYGRLAIELLHERGRRHVLMIAPPRDQTYSQYMIEGASNAAGQLGIAFEVLDTADSDSEGDRVRAAVRERLRECPGIDALIGASPTATMAATVGAEDLGRVVGQDIDIVSKEATRMLKSFRSAITVVHEDFFEAGRFMARALIQRIESPELAPLQHVASPDRTTRSSEFPDWMPVAETSDPSDQEGGT